MMDNEILDDGDDMHMSSSSTEKAPSEIPTSTVPLQQLEDKESEFCKDAGGKGTRGASPSQLQKPPKKVHRQQSCINVLTSIKTVDEVMESGRRALQTLDMRDKAVPQPIGFSLAVHYGTLNSSTIHNLDEYTKVMIVGAVRKLNKMSQNTWEEAVANMMQNPVIEAIPDGLVNRSDKVIKHGSDEFTSSSGQARKHIIDEVRGWLMQLIEDTDVLDTCNIDANLIANIVEKSAGTISVWEAIMGKRHEFNERVLVDIGVIRFPDITREWFKLYHLKLTAWLDTKRSRTHLTEYHECGITGEYTARKFVPRKTVITGLNATKKAEIIREAEALFKVE